jgi:hypothetical protein
LSSALAALGLVHGDHGSQYALVVEAAFQRQQAAMGAGRDMARHRIGWIDLKRRRALHVGSKRIAMREHEARHPIGQRRLADALRAADQPGMRNTSAAVGIEQCLLGLAMPEQRGGFARMDGCDGWIDLFGAHAECAMISASAAIKRSRTAIRT